jgi:hypothetical protein
MINLKKKLKKFIRKIDIDGFLFFWICFNFAYFMRKYKEIYLLAVKVISKK